MGRAAETAGVAMLLFAIAVGFIKFVGWFPGLKVGLGGGGGRRLDRDRSRRVSVRRGGRGMTSRSGALTLTGDRRGQNMADVLPALLLVVCVGLWAVVAFMPRGALQKSDVVQGHDAGTTLLVLGVAIALFVVVTIVQFVHSEVVR
jgi:hypothetical protein